MDGVKLLASVPEKLNSLLNIVESYRTDMKMIFGVDKCAILCMKIGKFSDGSN